LRARGVNRHLFLEEGGTGWDLGGCGGMDGGEPGF
jgi:hypothetical protein